jgi:hypothetical protein
MLAAQEIEKALEVALEEPNATLRPDGNGRRLFYFDCLVRTRYTGILAMTATAVGTSEARAWRAIERRYERRGWTVANPELRGAIEVGPGTLRRLKAMSAEMRRAA